MKITSFKPQRAIQIHNIEKRYILSLCDMTLFSPLYAYEPRGRIRDFPNIGLPQGSEVGIGFIVALIVLPLGFMIIRSSKDSSYGGCLGMILMGIGIIALLPLLAWLFSIINLVVGIGFLAFIVLAIIALVYKLLNKK
jgi:hypothetical protein